MTDLVPASLDSRITYSKALAASDLLPKQYRSNPANVLVALEYGAALGLAPMAAIQGIHVVEGRPTASAQLIGALVRNAGHRLRVTGDDTHATAVIVRADDPDFEFRAEWTLQRAQKAGLANKGVWKQYPAAMLKARAITEVARDACPEVLSGVAYTAEELDAEPAVKAVDTSKFTPKPTVERVETVTEVAVVDTETGEILPENVPDDEVYEAEMVDDEPPAAHVEASEPGITKAQTGKLFALLRALDIAEREAGLSMISDILGEQIESTSALTKAQASMVLDTLTAMASQQ